MQQANTCLIFLECIKADLGNKITANLTIPTIGICASIDCDGEVLVINDLICTDASLKKHRFVKSYANLNIIIENSVEKYCWNVINKIFPKKNTY